MCQQKQNVSISVTRHDGVTVMADAGLRVCFKVFTDIQAFRNQWYEITGNSWQMTEDDVYEAGLKLTSIKLKDFCQEYKTDVDGKVRSNFCFKSYVSFHGFYVYLF